MKRAIYSFKAYSSAGSDVSLYDGDFFWLDGVFRVIGAAVLFPESARIITKKGEIVQNIHHLINEIIILHVRLLYFTNSEIWTIP